MVSILYKCTILNILIFRSKEIIAPLYLNYKSRNDSSSESKDVEMVDKDDFLSYGTSPGFKHKT